MSIIKKIMSLVMVLAIAVGVTACGSSASGSAKGGAVEVYSYAEDFVEAGYEGDCINTNAYTLVLSGDSYTLQKAFYVNQISGVIVANTTTVFTGTCTSTEADGVKTVTLNAPTEAFCNMNGGVSTSADDPELLNDFEWSTITCDTANKTLTLG